MFKDINYCTDKLVSFWQTLQPAFKAKYPGWGIYLSCTFRPPDEQFELFCKGRQVFSHIDDKGKRIIEKAVILNTREVVTYVDGVTRVGSHSTSPSTAFDVAITNPDGHTNWNTDLSQWKDLGQFLVPGIIWGANWVHLKDYPHFEDTDYVTKFNSGRLT